MKYILAFIVAFVVMAISYLFNCPVWLNGWLSCMGWYSTLEYYELIKRYN